MRLLISKAQGVDGASEKVTVQVGGEVDLALPCLRRRCTGQDESEVRVPEDARGIDRPALDNLQGFRFERRSQLLEVEVGMVP